jgi:hypothetical protein
MTWPCNLVTRREHILGLLCIYLKLASLLASNGASVPYFMTWNKKLTYQLHRSGNFLRSQQYAQLVEKLSAFYWIQRFIAVITRTRHWFLPRPRRIQSMPFNPISTRSIIILSSHLRLRLQSGMYLFFRLSSQNYVCIFHLPDACYNV